MTRGDRGRDSLPSHGRPGGGSFGPPPPHRHPPPPGLWPPPPPSFHPPHPHRNRPPPPMFPVNYYSPPPPVFYAPLDRAGGATYQVPPDMISRPDRQKQWLARLKATYIFSMLALIIGTVWLYSGPYGSTVIELKAHDSRLITATPILVDSMKFTNRYEADGPLFYIFQQKPRLNQESRWQDSQNVTFQYAHRNFVYHMNKGSTVTVYYALEVRQRRESVYLAMVRDNSDDLQDYYEKPKSVGKALQGRGSIKFNIKADDDYAFSLITFSLSSVTVYLDLHFETMDYSTAGATQRSSLKTNSKLSLPVLSSRYGLLTGPDANEMSTDGWEIELSYGIRWTALILIYGLVTFVYSVMKSRARASINDAMEPEYAPLAPPQETQSTVFTSAASAAPSAASAASAAPPSAPLLPPSVLEEHPTILRDEEDEKDIPEDKLCVICLERRKDSFFIPCGHNATCYTCGLKISQEDQAKCPICRQPINDFKKLYDS